MNNERSLAMVRLLKTCHLLGLTLFLGSILGHIVASAAAGAPGTASFLYAREHIALATQFLTLPGLALSVLSGIALVVGSRLSPQRHRWLAAKIALTVAVMANSALFLAPAGARAFAGALALSKGDAAAMTEIVAALRAEQYAGAVNILLILSIVLLGVFKPRLQWRRHGAGGIVSTSNGAPSR
jgi:hypothetical protein